jgi:hypothetical protein
VDFPAPLAPTRARTSPCFSSNEIPRNAGTVSRENGCNSARHPDEAGGKYFSRFSTVSAKFSTERRYNLSNAGKQGLPLDADMPVVESPLPLVKIRKSRLAST